MGVTKIDQSATMLLRHQSSRRPAFIGVESSDLDMRDDLGTTMEILRRDYEEMDNSESDEQLRHNIQNSGK